MTPLSPIAYALAALLLAGILFGLVSIHLRFWVKRLTLELDYALEERLDTADGASIGLRRIPRVGDELAALPPVLLVHGLAANHRNQDIHPDYSLARYLAALERDVWLVTLRTGLPGVKGSLRFEAMARYDIPLAVSEVLARTGAKALDYVGFSMGGMLLYAALGRGVPESKIRRVVMVGSPGAVFAPRFIRPLLRVLPRWVAPRIPLRFWARLTAFASEWARTPLHHLVVNPLNVSAGITRASLVNCIEDVPAALSADFMRWAGDDGEIRVNGERVLDGLANASTPALFVAGSADRVAPAAAVRRAFDAWAAARTSTPKRFLTLGRDFGHRENYGHGDLALGAHVGVELFEPIARFLGPEEPLPGGAVGATAREEIEAQPAVAETSSEPR